MMIYICRYNDVITIGQFVLIILLSKYYNAINNSKMCKYLNTLLL